ncbi:hypothetical protein EVG20_g4541 [Dentipellis fragilis]|uniref:Uncharacterized protein n=1 Tax=Dentipellis fragilis TaxID=205917 RepID=A0A4Y9YWF1_9AGAM|nr:hypothetical protein EVG20_g4541 [Dentipellis fragilis]
MALIPTTLYDEGRDPDDVRWELAVADRKQRGTSEAEVTARLSTFLLRRNSFEGLRGLQSTSGVSWVHKRARSFSVLLHSVGLADDESRRSKDEGVGVERGENRSI